MYFHTTLAAGAAVVKIADALCLNVREHDASFSKMNSWLKKPVSAM
jgi:hypothetical protein